MTCGRGAYSTLRVLRSGLSVIEFAATPWPKKPISVHTFKSSPQDIHCSYLIVSFENTSKIFVQNDSKISEVTNSGFDLQKQTLHAATLEDESQVQITQEGVIHIVPAKNKKSKWMARGKILSATSNGRQVAVAIENGQMVYFELEDSTGQLKEMASKVFEKEIVSLSVSEIPEGRQRCRFIAAGFNDNSLRILSLDPENCLARISNQAFPAIPVSIQLVDFKEDRVGALYLHVGLENGFLIRTVVDNVTGAISDTRRKKLGEAPVEL